MSKTREWQTKARELFFSEHKFISDIAAELGKARETVSRYIRGLPDLAQEAEYRANESAKARKIYKKEWAASSRLSAAACNVTAQSLREEHFEAVATLSKEKY